MLKSLKIKFVAANMLLVFTVLAAVLGFLYFSTAREEQASSTQALRFALEQKDGAKLAPEIHPARSRPQNESKSGFKPVFTVTFLPDGSVASYNTQMVTISEETLENAAQSAFAADGESGVLPDFNLMYMKSAAGPEIRIAFLSLADTNNALRALLLRLLAIMAFTLLAFLLISMFLAEWALRPVKNAWRQQRQFVAYASHELKTPLTVIMANTDILLARPCATIDSQLQWIESTKAESQKMQRLVRDMLLLAKSDDVKKSSGRADLSAAVLHSCLSFESVAYEKRIDYDYSEIAQGLFVSGDEADLRRLCSILVDNAAKYADEGGFIKITLKRESDCAVLRVKNSGQPIPPADLPHIFERFYRADKSRSDNSFGLGLSIAKSITDSLSGKISACSGADGTVFELRLRRL